MNSLLIIAGLSSALCYGISDYMGGRASARIAIVQVLVIGEIVGAGALWALAWWYHEAWLATGLIGVAVGAGMVGALGVASLYHGIARGHAAVTAPVSALLAAVIPVIYGMGSDGIPKPLVLLGMAIGIIAIVLNSLSGSIDRFAGLWQGVLAGVAFGVYFVLLKYLGQAEGLFLPLALSRSCALLITIPWLLIRPGGRTSAAGIGLAIVAGGFDIAAGMWYILATQSGRLDIAGVLASLYPGVTVLLAYFINREQISIPQRWGLVATIIATALIAS